MLQIQSPGLNFTFVPSWLSSERAGYSQGNQYNSLNSFTVETAPTTPSEFNLQTLAQHLHALAVEEATTAGAVRTHEEYYDLVYYPLAGNYNPHPDRYTQGKITLRGSSSSDELNARFQFIRYLSGSDGVWTIQDTSTSLVVPTNTTPAFDGIYKMILMEMGPVTDNGEDYNYYGFGSNYYYATDHGATMQGYEFLKIDETPTAQDFYDMGYGTLQYLLNKNGYYLTFFMAFMSTDLNMIDHDPEHNTIYNPDNPPSEPTDADDDFSHNTTNYDNEFDQDNDHNDTSNLTNTDAVTAGAVTVYEVTNAGVTSLMNFLMDPDLETKVAHLFKNNPMEYIVALNQIPVNLTGTSGNIKVGGYDTNISATKVGRQFIKINCGSITLKEKYGKFLDYSPFSKVKIFLPFIGYQELDTVDCMGGTIKLDYFLDIINCVCLAQVHCTNSLHGSSKSLSHVTYSFSGSFGLPIPLCASDYRARATALIGAVGGVVAGGVAVASGGSALPLLATAGIGALNVATSKPNISRSGSFSGNSSIMGEKTPYLLIERPVQSIPGFTENGNKHYTYMKQRGYMSNTANYIKNFSGFTMFSSFRLHDLDCTDEEYSELEQLLKDGVYL